MLTVNTRIMLAGCIMDLPTDTSLLALVLDTLCSLKPHNIQFSSQTFEHQFFTGCFGFKFKRGFSFLKEVEAMRQGHAGGARKQRKG